MAEALWGDQTRTAFETGAGTIGLSAVPGSPLSSFYFECGSSACDPATVTDTRTFTNEGTIPMAVWVRWAGAASCGLFDVRMATDATPPLDYEEDLCDLLSEPNGVRVSPQVGLDPGDSLVLDITIIPNPAAAPAGLSPTSQTLWGQWTSDPPAFVGWADQGPPVGFTIETIQLGASLTVIKTVDNGAGGTATADWWTMNVTAVNPSDASFPGEESPGTTITIDPGAFSVSESGGAGAYTPGYSADCSGTAVGGDSYTCTVTNTYTAPSWPQTLTSPPVAFTRPSANAVGTNVVANVDLVDTIVINRIWDGPSAVGPWASWNKCAGVTLLPGGSCSATHGGAKGSYIKVDYTVGVTPYSVVFDFLNLRVVP